MEETVTIPAGRLAYLEERARKLAREKSEMQLIIHMMNRLNAEPGLDSVIDTMLQSVVEIIGGNNLALYYRIDDQLYYADLCGTRKALQTFDDDLVAEVFASGEAVELQRPFSATHMLTPEFSAACTWIYPLNVGQERVGVLKMECLHVSMQEMYPQFPTFFKHAALLLKNEILGHTRLKKAFDRLSELNAELAAEIEERERAEQSLLAIRDQLEQTVQERTLKLHEQTVELKREMQERQKAQEALTGEHHKLQQLNITLEERIAEEIEKNREKERIISHQARLAAMGEMLSNIAHQWRQPLNNLGLYLQNLQLDYNDSRLTAEDFNSYIASAMETIQYLSRTISDFQNFFKPDRERVRFSLNTAIEETVRLVAVSLQAWGITLAVTAEGGCDVLGFPNEFSQALLNIINNARDAVLERRIAAPRIEVSCLRDGNEALVVIRDNGGGIPEELLDKIFDPYFTTKAKMQGTGLGLYMAKMILTRSMGGRLTARNTADGAEFVMRLPAVPPHSADGGTDRESG